MKPLLILLLCGFSVLVLPKELDLRLFQYPVEDAKRSAQSTFPTFTSYIMGESKERRIPGLSPDQLAVVKKKYRVKLMNKYRLYDKTKMDVEEKILLERYCTRYNRQLANLLGI